MRSQRLRKPDAPKPCSLHKPETVDATNDDESMVGISPAYRYDRSAQHELITIVVAGADLLNPPVLRGSIPDLAK